MMDYFWIVIGVIALISTPYYFWNEGHSGAWGAIQLQYKAANPPSKFNFYNYYTLLLDNGKWKGIQGFNYHVDELNLYIAFSIPFLRWAIPTVQVPISRIEVSNTDRFQLLFKRTILKINDANVQIAVPVNVAHNISNNNA
jgi:hypothetical protein